MAHKDRIGDEPWDIVLIRVLTDEGIEGNAFGYGIRSGEITAKMTVELLKPALVGEDPLDREKIWQKIRTLDRWLALFPIYAQGPIDVALWDIAGKAAGMPLFKLIGGYRDNVRAYATAAWAIPDIDCLQTPGRRGAVTRLHRLQDDRVGRPRVRHPADAGDAPACWRRRRPDARLRVGL